MRHLFRIVAYVALSALLAMACARTVAHEISRERAIEIARSQITFQASTVEAVKVSVAGRSLWRVRIRGRLPGQPPELFETRTVEIDRLSGAVVSASRS